MTEASPFSIIAKKLVLVIKDKTWNQQKQKKEQIMIKIHRKFTESRARNSEYNAAQIHPDGVILKKGEGVFDHNIMLYTEHLDAYVTGYLVFASIYSPENTLGNDKNQDRHIPLKPFTLSLPQGQELIENRTFTNFWNAHDQYLKDQQGGSAEGQGQGQNKTLVEQ